MASFVQMTKSSLRWSRFSGLAGEESVSKSQSKMSFCPTVVHRQGSPGSVRAESHAAAVKHNVTAIETMIGITKKYLQARTVMAAKQRANVHAVPRMRAKDSGGRPPSCHANTTASRRNALTKSPKPT